MKKQLIPFVIAVALSVLFFTLGAVTCKRTQIVEVEKPYPVTVEKPVPVHDTVYETRAVYLPKVSTVHDTVTETVTTTVFEHDTVQVQVPISRQDYEIDTNDVNLKMRISGFQPELEYLSITNLKKCPRTHRNAAYRRFSVGVGILYGLPLKNATSGVYEPQPCFGVTLSYRLWDF